MGFSEKLNELRKRAGLSQKELADKLGVSQASINYWEKGQRTPSIDMVSLIADYFQVSFDYLIGLEKSDGFCSMTIFEDEIDDYVQEIGEFLYYNPNYKPLFDSVMEVKQSDLELAKQMLDRINGMYTSQHSTVNQSIVAAHNPEVPEEAPEDSDGSKGTNN